MAKVAITKTLLNDLSNAITDKTGASNPMTIADMIDAVEGITSRDSTDLTASGGTVTVPAGMYAAQATKSAVSGTKSITANGTGIDVAEYASVDVSVPSSQPSLQSKSVTKSTSGTETYTPDSGYDGLSSVAVTVPAADMFSTVIGEFYTDGRRYWRERPVISNSRAGILAAGYSYGNYVLYDAVPTGTIVTPSTSAQTIGGAKYMMEGAVTVAAMPSGTAGTPTATKGTVSNHAVSVTPSVTNSTGYIAGGTLTGTAVSVSASELVSGTLSITSSGTADVTNYASASVAAGGATASATKGTVSNHSVTVTPSVTRTAGYVTAGTSSGTAVTVSASELVSGDLAITENGSDIDVTNYATVSVSVSGGGGGTVQVGTKTATLASTASSISFTGLSGNPTSFAVTSQADISTGGDLVSGVVFDGTSIHAQTVTSQAEYAGTGFSKSYSNGTLTITATSASFAANAYELVYTYGGSSSDIHTANVQVGSGATSITFSGLSGRPAYFSVIFKSDFGTSSGYQRVIEVVNDGTDTYGMCLDSTAHAASYWTYSYSGGALTVTSQGTNAGGYFHQPGYYQLTYAVDGSAPSYQTKTGIGATTTSQTITADAGYDALESVQINAITQTNLTAANIKSGTTVTISNGNGNLWSVLGTYSGGGSSSSIDTKTATNSDDQATSLTFSSMKGQPIAFFLRCTSQLTRSSNYSYYYITDMRYNGTNTTGNYYRRSNGTFYNDTSHYSFSYSGTTLTISSSASRGAAGGSFYNGGYELVYIY